MHDVALANFQLLRDHCKLIENVTLRSYINVRVKNYFTPLLYHPRNLLTAAIKSFLPGSCPESGARTLWDMLRKCEETSTDTWNLQLISSDQNGQSNVKRGAFYKIWVPVEYLGPRRIFGSLSNIRHCCPRASGRQFWGYSATVTSCLEIATLSNTPGTTSHPRALSTLQFLSFTPSRFRDFNSDKFPTSTKQIGHFRTSLVRMYDSQ